MTMFVPISEAKSKLAELLRASEDEDVLLMRHGHPAGVLMSTRRHAELLATLDDLEDRLSVLGREHSTMDFEKLSAELQIG